MPQAMPHGFVRGPSVVRVQSPDVRPLLAVPGPWSQNRLVGDGEDDSS